MDSVTDGFFTALLFYHRSGNSAPHRHGAPTFHYAFDDTIAASAPEVRLAKRILQIRPHTLPELAVPCGGDDAVRLHTGAVTHQ